MSKYCLIRKGDKAPKDFKTRGSFYFYRNNEVKTSNFDRYVYIYKKPKIFIDKMTLKNNKSEFQEPTNAKKLCAGKPLIFMSKEYIDEKNKIMFKDDYDIRNTKKGYEFDTFCGKVFEIRCKNLKNVRVMFKDKEIVNYNFLKPHIYLSINLLHDENKNVISFVTVVIDCDKKDEDDYVRLVHLI
jgi:hypothetical protein